MHAVVADDLTFRYGSGDARPAISNCSFRAPKGEIYGVLGPNGAGKTTLLRLIGTLLAPEEGTLEVLGHRLPGAEAAVRSSVGIAIGEYERTFDFRLTARQNLRYFASFYPSVPRSRRDERIEEALDMVGLGYAADLDYASYSQGMKHRLALARALLPDPEVLLLDEPTSGVDAETTRGFLDLLSNLTAEGVTLVFATHHMSEASRVCDRVLVLREGQRVAEEDPDKLRGLTSDVEVLEFQLEPRPDERLLAELRDVRGVVEVVQEPTGELRVHLRADSEAAFTVLERVRTLDYRLRDIRRDAPSLEEAFLELTGGTPA